MAEDNIRYTIVRTDCPSVLGLIQHTDSAFIILIFPVLFISTKCVAVVTNGNLSYRTSQAVENTFNNNLLVYILRIEKNPGSFVQTLLLHYVPGELICECLDEEALLIEKLLKKLYQAEVKIERPTLKQLYLKILLQCMLEILDRTDTFGSREVLLVKEFNRLLGSDHIPKRQVKYYADRLCVSRRYLTWAVHKISGVTPKSLIDDNLIEKAKLLLQTSKSVYIIAEELQFESHASFTSFFKKHTGLTPSSYRNNDK